MVWQRKEQKDRKFVQHHLTAIDWPSEELFDNDITEEDRELNTLYTAISKLSETDRALVMMQLDGLSYKEMAEVTGLSETNIGAKLNRIKTKLIALVEEIKK
jgi:RNA polymerase sigma-70 factor (ECF subfamily)